ncbi:MAG: thermonuclease family protein [Magnetococcales bacterium]|nr:thermonuclease family protein [Magnetococcales bacterium]
MRLFIPLLLLALLIPAIPSRAEELSGVAEVLTPDILRLNEINVRLAGMDGWQPGQTCPDTRNRPNPCGEEALTFLRSAAQQQMVYCAGFARDSEGRRTATCFQGGRDLGALMVRNGWAIATPRGASRYEAQEKIAREEKAGGWRGLPRYPPQAPDKWGVEQKMHKEQ